MAAPYWPQGPKELGSSSIDTGQSSTPDPRSTSFGRVICSDDVVPAGIRAPNPTPVRDIGAGVFAVGDVRRGSIKGLAAAVAEESSAVPSVHDYFASIS